MKPLPVYGDPTQKILRGNLISLKNCINLTSNYKTQEQFFDQEHFIFSFIMLFFTELLNNFHIGTT